MKGHWAAGFGLVLALAAPTIAGTVDFEDVTPTSGTDPFFGAPQPGAGYGGTTLASRGFVFGAPGPDAIHHAHLVSNPVNTEPDQTQYYPDNGTQYVGIDALFLTMAESSGAVFSLFQFDAAEGFLGGRLATGPSGPFLTANRAFQLEVVGHLFGGGTVTALFDFDDINDSVLGNLVDFQTFFLPSTFRNLVGVSFDGIDVDGAHRTGAFSIDNVEVTAVPLPPAAWTGLILLGGFLLFRRRGSPTR